MNKTPWEKSTKLICKTLNSLARLQTPERQKSCSINQRNARPYCLPLQQQYSSCKLPARHHHHQQYSSSKLLARQHYCLSINQICESLHQLLLVYQPNPQISLPATTCLQKNPQIAPALIIITVQNPLLH